MLCELNEVTDHLFISSARSVTATALQQKGITCIINCSLMNPTYSISGLKYYPIMVEDTEKENIAQYFDDITSLIDEEHKSGGKTLVYCVAGISRSSTFCIAYLMKYQNFTLRNAYKHIRSRRRIVQPNNSFFRQLINYEQKLFNETTVKMLPVPGSDNPGCVVPDVFYEVCKGIIWFRSCKNRLLETRSKNNSS